MPIITKKECRTLAFAVFALMAYLPNAGAQLSPGNSYSNDIDIYSRDIPTRSAREQSGSVGITESDFNYDYQLKAFGKLPVDFSINSQYIDINNSTAVYLPAHLTGYTAGIETTVPFFDVDRTYFHVGVFPSFYGDNSTFSSANFRIPSKYYFIYKLNDQWAFVAGAAVYPYYETAVSPIAGVIYKPNDKLTFYLVPDRPNVSYALTDKLTLFAEGWYYSDNEYVFNTPTTKNAVLRYTEGRLGTGIKYKITKNIEISLTGGAIFLNSFKYRYASGKIDMDNGPYVELRLRIKF